MAGDQIRRKMPFLAKYEATVITGFEELAAQEVKDKLKIPCVHSQGKVTFETDANPNDIIKLRSVDNVYVVIANQTLEKMPQDNQDDLNSKLSDLIPVIDWENGLSVWKEVSSFERSSISEILTPGGD